MIVNPSDATGAVDWLRAATAAPEVVKAVQRYDPLLHIYFDTAVCRWAICRGTPSGWHFITLWQTRDGDYRPLDMRVLDALRRWDLRPNTVDAPKDAAAIARQWDEDHLRQEQKDIKTFEDDVSYATRENMRFLTRRVAAALNR